MKLRTLGLALATVVVGAFIVAGGSWSQVHAKDVTFAEDIAPIVFTKCASCHRPGEAAPFALLSYDDVKKRGRLIESAVTAHVMPPWKAGAGDYAYKGDRRLTDEQIDTVRQFVAAGMPEGDPKKLPEKPVFVEGWQLGKPDLVVSMPEAFEVPASGPDVYRNFVLPLNQTEDRFVRAVDFRPSARSVVHHSLFFLDATGSARLQDAGDPKPGFAGTMGGFAGGRGALLRLFAVAGGGGLRPAPDLADEARRAGGLGGWALGAQPHPLPEGLAFLVPKGSDLVLSTHFHPSGKTEQEASVVGLYFSTAPPTRAFAAIQLPPIFGLLEGLDIPAGEKQYTVRDSWTVPADVKAFSAGAHAHYLAKHMSLTATLPEGGTKTLLEIRDWDFAWQDQYQFQEFVSLPKGTRLDVSITYDNSADNPRNPNHPPTRVTWGEQSTDEMGSMGLQVVADRDEDIAALQQAYVQHVRQAAMSRPGLRLLMQQRSGRGLRP